MPDESPRESVEAAAYRRRAQLFERAARVYEESANMHELFARHCRADFVVAAQSNADNARERAERSQSRSDDLNALAAEHEAGLST